MSQPKAETNPSEKPESEKTRPSRQAEILAQKAARHAASLPPGVDLAAYGTAAKTKGKR